MAFVPKPCPTAVQCACAGGEVKFDIPHRIFRVYGRQLGILGADGSRSTVARSPI
jgi:hypothetical protein